MLCADYEVVANIYMAVIYLLPTSTSNRHTEKHLHSEHLIDPRRHNYIYEKPNTASLDYSLNLAFGCVFSFLYFPVGVPTD